MTSKDALHSGKHIAGLDVIRGMAILMVVTYHGFNSISPQNLSAMPDWFQLACVYSGFLHLGVHLFFILSGFLITRILLDSKNKPDYYKNFYLRRIARIAPAYLLVLAALLISGYISLKYALVCLLFMCNMPGILGVRNEYGPLWSLSVEEQFYLAWPFVAKKLNQRQLFVLAASIIILSPGLRWILQFGPTALRDIHFKTWAVSDFFAAGALAALCIHNSVKVKPIGWLAVLAGLISVWMQFNTGNWGSPLDKALYPTPYLMLFTGIILLAYDAQKMERSKLGRFFCFFGEISYGLYLIHQFVFDVTSQQFATIGMVSVQMHVAVQLTLEFGIATLIALVSRRTIEAWFLSRTSTSQSTKEIRLHQAALNT
ncbi:MAG: acyltransferase [Burkholderiales bacterium]|nr:acyltransferase [Burkholderiales bacterium]